MNSASLMDGRGSIMEAIIVSILVLILLIWLCKRLSRFSYRVADYLNTKERLKEQHETAVLRTLEQIKDSVATDEPEDPIGVRERLLLANAKLRERQDLKTAMEDELGIK